MMNRLRPAFVASAILLLGVAGAAPAAQTTSTRIASASNRYLENLTPENSVFVAVDYLTGFQPAIRTMDKDLYRNNLTGLAKTVNIFKMPTIVLGDEGGPRGKFMPQVGEHFRSAPVIGRRSPSAWRERAFVEAVQRTGRRKLILAGISTDNCTLLTALDAMRAGYQVYIVVDVSGAESRLIEESAVQRLIQAGAVPVTWVSLGSELLTAKGGWETPEGRALAQVYTDHTLYFQQ